MVKDYLHSEWGNLLPPHGLLFLINSINNYFLCKQIAYNVKWPQSVFKHKYTAKVSTNQEILIH